MKISIAFAGAAVAALSLAGVVRADTIYNNPYVIGNGGDCSFSTTCAADVGRGDDFAAQEFTLTSAAVVTGASFTELDLGVTPTDVNWGFINADGAGGLPGSYLSAGEDVVSSTSVIGTDQGYNLTNVFFNVGPQALGPGTYYFAIQAVSPVFDTYLGFGAAPSGAAETMDGGVTWAFGYELESQPNPTDSVAVGLFGTTSTVPEPAAWAMLVLGLGGIGAVLRRRERAASVA